MVAGIIMHKVGLNIVVQRVFKCFSEMLHFASCGDIIELHLLSPDETLVYTAGLENELLSHGHIHLYENIYENILSWKGAVTAFRHVQTEGGSSEGKMFFTLPCRQGIPLALFKKKDYFGSYDISIPSFT